ALRGAPGECLYPGAGLRKRTRRLYPLGGRGSCNLRRRMRKNPACLQSLARCRLHSMERVEISDTRPRCCHQTRVGGACGVGEKSRSLSQGTHVLRTGDRMLRSVRHVEKHAATAFSGFHQPSSKFPGALPEVSVWSALAANAICCDGTRVSGLCETYRWLYPLIIS